jgi:hypothetical protein
MAANPGAKGYWSQCAGVTLTVGDRIAAAARAEETPVDRWSKSPFTSGALT